jgi:hypothetical protein
MDDALAAGQDRTFAFKFPGAYDAIDALCDETDNIRVVDIGRNLDRVVASLLAKGWFRDENLGPDATGLWPFHDHDGEYMVPYPVHREDCDRWQSMSAETRTVYMCNRLAEDRLSFHERYEQAAITEIRYERLIEDPESVTNELLTTLQLDSGPKTEGIVDEIKPTTSEHDVEALLTQCADDVAMRFRELRNSFEQ